MLLWHYFAPVKGSKVQLRLLDCSLGMVFLRLKFCLVAVGDKSADGAPSLLYGRFLEVFFVEEVLARLAHDNWYLWYHQLEVLCAKSRCFMLSNENFCPFQRQQNFPIDN